MANAIAAVNAVSASFLYDPVKDADGGVVESSDQARTDDLTALTGGNSYTARVTRMRSDLAHAALATDLVLTASLDQASLSRNLYVTSTKNAPPCPTYPPPGPCPPKPTNCPAVTCNNDSGGVWGSCATTTSPSDRPRRSDRSSSSASSSASGCAVAVARAERDQSIANGVVSRMLGCFLNTGTLIARKSAATHAPVGVPW